MNCGHQECHCLAAPHSSYCSDECQHAARFDPAGPCPCEHPGVSGPIQCRKFGGGGSAAYAVFRRLAAGTKRTSIRRLRAAAIRDNIVSEWPS